MFVFSCLFVICSGNFVLHIQIQMQHNKTCILFHHALCMYIHICTCMYCYVVSQDWDVPKHTPKWHQVVGGPFTKEDMFCVDLRRLQQRCGCSDATCKEILKTFGGYLRMDTPKSLKKCDKKLHAAAGAQVLRLNGCPSCNKTVFLPDDPAVSCPYVKADGTVCGHARSDMEQVFYFPITSKLQALLSLPKYRSMIQHESLRGDADDLMSDVYDSPAWKEFMGKAVYPNNRVGFQVCGDGIPAFSFSKSHSLKPVEFVNLSLPPAVRGKIENILLLMLLPEGLGEGQKKYYDFAATFELNELYHNGVSGVKVKVFSSSLDTPGRAEFLGSLLLQFFVLFCDFITTFLIYLTTHSRAHRDAKCSSLSKLLYVYAHVEPRSSSQMHVRRLPSFPACRVPWPTGTGEIWWSHIRVPGCRGKTSS